MKKIYGLLFYSIVAILSFVAFLYFLFPYNILKESLFNRAYEGEWQYDEDEFTELDDNDIIAEIIREQLFQTYQKNLSY